MTSTSGSSTRRRRGGSSTGSTASRSRPCSGRRSRRASSAGRVQSVATRLVVERERERMRFVAARYWDVLGTFDPGAFEARLASVGGRRIAQGRDFGPDGKAREEVVVLDEERARRLATQLEGRPFAVRAVDESPYTAARRPVPTSTLQQEASRKLRFSSHDDARRPEATRTATSPTCAPTR